MGSSSELLWLFPPEVLGPVEDEDELGLADVGVVAINFCRTSLIFNWRVFLLGNILAYFCWNAAVA